MGFSGVRGMVIVYFKFQISNLKDKGRDWHAAARTRNTGSGEWLLIIGDSKLQNEGADEGRGLTCNQWGWAGWLGLQSGHAAVADVSLL